MGSIRELAAAAGFELAGAAAAVPSADYPRYRAWVDAGMAGAMGYLADHRAEVRFDPRNLLASARTILCLGKLYNSPAPYSTQADDPYRGWISRYAWGEDYHSVLRRDLETLARSIPGEHEYRVCVDTAPLLERSYARQAGLGWIGKNTCLINEPRGSWFFLGEILTSLEMEPDSAAADRCGTCTRCIDACPTGAISPGGYELDARLCISYFTIELKGPIPEASRAGMGRHVFGCDICQDVCPWNRRAPVTEDRAFQPGAVAPPLDRMAALTEAEFRAMFRHTPVSRTRYIGFVRNVAVAMGNSGRVEFRPALERLAAHESPLVSEHARWALNLLDGRRGQQPEARPAADW